MRAWLAGKKQMTPISVIDSSHSATLIPHLENFNSVSLLRYGKELSYDKELLQCLNIIVCFIDMGACDTIRFEACLAILGRSSHGSPDEHTGWA